MLKRFTTLPLLACLALLAAFALTLGSGGRAAPATASAAAPCTIQGGSEKNYTAWGAQIIKRSPGFTCFQAKSVMKACAKSRTVRYWRISNIDSEPRFRSVARLNYFSVRLAGGSPKCLSRY